MSKFNPQKFISTQFAKSIGTIRKCEPTITGNKQSNTWFVSGDKKNIILKHIQPSFQDRAIHVVELLDYLYKQRIAVPKIILSDTNELYITNPNGLNIALSYVEHTPESIDPISLGEELGKLHDALSTYKDPALAKRPFEYPWPEDDQLIKYKEIATKYNKEADTLFLQHYDVIVSSRSQINQHISQLNSLPKQLIHGDLTSDNILSVKGNITAFLDFDSVHTAPCIKDIGFAAMRLLYGDSDKVVQFIAAYSRIHNLTQNELHTWSYYYMRETLDRLHYILIDYYENNKNTWISDLKKHINSLIEIQPFL